MTSTVFSLQTGKEVGVWSLPPRQALIAAREQARRNYNTWNYPADDPAIEEGKVFIFLGDFAVRKEPR